MRRIYVASSWRNTYQQETVNVLRNLGHQVYDFRNPTEGYDNPIAVAHGFHWSDIDPHWQGWTPEGYKAALKHPISGQGFASDWGAMQWADTCVLVLPSGRSAHLEGGYFTGAGKELFVLMLEPQEPELMYLMATDVIIRWSALGRRLDQPVTQ